MIKQQKIIKNGVVIIILLFFLIGGFEFVISGLGQSQVERFGNDEIPLLCSNAEKHPLGTMTVKTSCCDDDIERWAVIIAASGGVSYAMNELMDRNDVKKLTKVLLMNGWDEDHFLFLIEEKATTEAIMNESFSWLRSNGEDEDDIVLFYFCGHGYYHTHDEPPLDEPDGRDEIIHPWDPDFGGWNPDVFILDDALAARFDTLKSKNIVIIMATCHAGGMIDGSQDLCGSGRVVLTSCDVDEASYGMRIPCDWIFPYYCVKGLQGHADRNNDKCVSAEEMFEYTVEPVEFRAYLLSFFHPRIPIGSSSQHPQMYDGWPTEEDNEDEILLVDLGDN